MKENSENLDHALQILKGNLGFEDNMLEWAPLVTRLGIKSVHAAKINDCPFCGSIKYINLSQYLYYSTLSRLRICSDCGLVYSDVKIDKALTMSHFETGYKDEGYFKNQREDIFRQIVDLLCKELPQSANVLDCGGATGVLAEMLMGRRPDISIMVSDISSEACDKVRSRGIKAVQGSLSGLLDKVSEKFDAVLLIDVLYYEEELKKAFSVLGKLLKTDGIILYRGPNKYFLIKAAVIIRSIFTSRKQLSISRRIPFFNPEHLYILRPGFLLQCFRSMGFSNISLLPSPSIKKYKGVWNFAARLVDIVAVFIFRLTASIVSPSYFLIARNNMSDKDELN
ncbi:MAG TPA: class I SAM-dependent methyltransferase [Oligoflexia bacterium]|nr:class I SAM-dependent methyltransferase [Oligoflexia bacterium]HMP49817.1 class I SAM-dependent methyltransferase [Oligoflexia bacterium]